MIKTLCTLLMLYAISSPVLAAAPNSGSSENGAKLHAKQCQACHGDDVYTRKNRNVTSMDALLGQVNGCNHNLNKRLSQEQVDDLVRFLNDKYYKFN